MNEFRLISKKKKKENAKNLIKARKLQKLKFLILKYLDPIQTHRFYGDFIIPDKLWQFSESGIYRFRLYHDHKVIRQLHVRNNGIILEFEDYFEKGLSPKELIQSRLNSLGDRTAYEFAEFLTKYEEMFVKLKEEEEKVKEESTEYSKKKHLKLSEEKAFQWIDTLFENNKENIVFVRGSKIVNGNDYRTKYLAYNSKLLEWITPEINVFNNDFIDSCLKIFKFKDFEDFAYSFKCCMLKKPFPKYMHTLMGEILIYVDPQVHFIQSEQLIFHVVIHEKERFDPKFLLQLKGRKEAKGLKITENERISSKNYGNLIKLYYMNR